MKIPPFPMNEHEIYRTVKDTLANHVKLKSECKNCTHWHKFYTDNGWGLCSKITHVDELTLIKLDTQALVSVGGTKISRLETRRDFSCILFEQTAREEQ